MKLVPTIAGSTRFIPLIGHPTGQVHSPGPINRWFVDNDVDCVMLAVDILPHAVPAFLNAMRATENCAGLSVTMPHKQAAFENADRVTERARLARAVNVLRRDSEGTLTGDMVDGLAMIMALGENGVTVAGKRLLVVGAGGAGSAIIHALAAAGAETLVIIERNAARLDVIRLQLADSHPALAVHAALPDGLSIDIAINASPLGMKQDDPLPFPLDALHGAQIVADAVTKPAVTPWLQAAQALGLRTQAGAAMTQAQLPVQLEFWGFAPKPEEARR
jgi:shikimate dehydrogenase